MDLTLDMFKSICATLNTKPRFLDLIKGMGSKSRPTDQQFTSCYCYLQQERHRMLDSETQQEKLLLVSRKLHHFAPPHQAF